ncbi:MAG: Fe(3+) ABC transporter substrate-binding protein [Burkholderiaceae bacterium]
MKHSSFLKSLAAALAFLATAASVAAAADINLYSYRQPFLIKPLTDAFTKQTGTRVNVVYASKGVLERIRAEGQNSPADAVLTADIGSLTDLVNAGVLAPTRSVTLEKLIPANLRHPDGLWYGLTTRARVVFASTKRIPADANITYESLADPIYRGRICTRSGKHVYNVSLIASMIAHHGEDKTKQWLQGVKANLARKPQGNDRAQAKAIYSGQCDLAIGNSYYYGKMVTNDEKPEQKEWAKAIRVVFPNQQDRGAHINISGAGVLKASKNKAQAIEFIEFLTSQKAQEIYASQNFEYPVIDGVAIDTVTAAMGKFKGDAISLTEVANHRKAAAKLVDAVGFDNGPTD